MKKFEYKVETFLLNDKPNTDRINELAEEGWELISVVGNQMVSSYCAQVATSFFYKREILEYEM
jgi:hypothetical protein